MLVRAEEERAMVRKGRQEFHDLGFTESEIHHGLLRGREVRSPTQKPIDLMRRPILNYLKRSELVCEPFSGSGTTLAAAELTERVCCAIELDPKYVDVAVQRWQSLSGKKAKLEADGRTFAEIAEERRKAAA
jgi:DNA modification methylase